MIVGSQNSTPATGETEDDMKGLVDSSGSEDKDDGYLDELRGKPIVDGEGRRIHRVICSNGSPKSNYECGSCG